MNGRNESNGKKLFWVAIIIGVGAVLVLLTNVIVSNNNPWHGWDELFIFLLCVAVVAIVYKLFHPKPKNQK